MPSSNQHRPDPDELLAKVTGQEADARRGKLRVSFGSSAGAGKTYAMLAAARKLKLEGRDVEVRVPRDLPLVRIDALLIERVLVNALENASKYSPPGSKIIFAAEVIADRLSVSVSDNGPGLMRGREEGVFQKFARGERESATPGVGLGLAICRAIVAAHLGSIVATHRPGGGAGLTFTLPLGPPPAAAVEAQAAHG